MDVTNLIRCLLLGLTAIVGDRLVEVNQHNDVKKALCDNVTHAAIGLITWINVYYNLGKGNTLSGKVLVQSLVCAFISSAIDLDHFIAARSFHLKDATKLPRRPPFHCTTLPLIMFPLLLLVAHYAHSANLELFGWILLAAFLSHHVRDAARRGFWFWPFGSTSPLGPGLYVIFTVLFPFVLSSGIYYSKSSFLRLRSHSDTISVV